MLSNYKYTPQLIAKDVLNVAKVAKFRQFWSHWLQRR